MTHGKTSREKTEPVLSDAARLVNYGVDWLTVTCKPGDTQYEFEEMAHALMQVEAGMGNKVKPWSMSGFNGISCGSAGFGAREDMSLMRLSSDRARNDWRRAYRLATHCSRIDLQVTFKLDGPVLPVIRHCHDRALASVATWKRPPEILLRDSNVTGLTLYLNRRTSERFGRVYDKGVESKSKELDQCIRFECQYNGEAGSAMARKLHGQGPRDVMPLAQVAAYFAGRGLVLPSPNVPVDPLVVCRRRTDAQAMLEWLYRQVRPAIGKLIAEGRYEDVVSALQLPQRDELDHVRLQHASQHERKFE